MSHLLLACGPYFDEAGEIGSIVLFLVVKPLAYFAFIQAFRFRVSRPIPMRLSQAARLAAARAGLGIALVAPAALLLANAPGEGLLIASWVYLYAERVFSWWLVGSRGAQLRGRRLTGWIISGTMINAAFDAAVVMGLAMGLLPQLVIVGCIADFTAALHVAGRRASLRMRFDSITRCAGCTYDLTGNLSGRCPECGLAIVATARA